jgi:hypothetical protein
MNAIFKKNNNNNNKLLKKISAITMLDCRFPKKKFTFFYKISNCNTGFPKKKKKSVFRNQQLQCRLPKTNCFFFFKQKSAMGMLFSKTNTNLRNRKSKQNIILKK